MKQRKENKHDSIIILTKKLKCNDFFNKRNKIMDEIYNTEDIIDTRDVIERISKLENLIDEAEPNDDIEAEREELDALIGLQNSADKSPDWPNGEILISESYFPEYCQELCKDIGDLPRDLPWYIENHIDWDGVAEDIRIDYMEIDFDGVTYLIRA